MTFLDRVLGTIGLERRASNPSDPYWTNMSALRGNGVTPRSAESVSAVYACVSAISETIASLPLILYRREGDDGRNRAKDHPLYKVLHDQPNGQQTALEFREQMQASVLLRGNAYAEIRRGYDGQVRELLPMHADRVQVLKLDTGRLAYEWNRDNGTTRRLLQEEVLHLRHRSDNGVLGVSPISAAREVVELAIAEREHGSATFRNGTKASGVLKFPGTLNPEQRKAVGDSWASQYAGAANAGKTPILESGVDYTPLSMTLEDAEWLGARQFSVEEVCRLFRVPPTVVGDLRHGNYSNSVEMARQFVTLTLRRHLSMWEQSIARCLLTDAGRRVYFAEHSVEGLLRGDSLARAQFYERAITDGWMDTDEVRRLENLPARSINA
ncbi:MAG: phage portal protein [Rubrivivax sp.]|nr:phage portal protein [Rubrivivax sp.]